MGIHKSHSIDEQLDMITVEVHVDLTEIITDDTEEK